MRENVHQGASLGHAVKRLSAKASFDAHRLSAFRKLLNLSRQDGSAHAYIDSVEAECRRLAAGLIAGEQVEA